MSTLPAPLRRQLESAAQAARNIAEIGARKALEALAVHESDPYRHMNEAQRTHRRQLRAQARQLGDGESSTEPGTYEIKHLVEKLAYDQWHRLLFARFLLENNLLISPEHRVSVSLDDCEELAPSLGLKDAWTVAARFAAVELPEIFRADDPAGSVELPVEDRKGLIQLVTGLPVDVFTASDSLGWCYQFWQAERKEQVNAAGNKIGADELPSVTQLFTEDYMVDFLLDNTLGAWWAGKKLTTENADGTDFETEQDCRNAVALPGCEWKYLRCIREPTALAAGSDDDSSDGETPEASANGSGSWRPAAGTFDGWPKTAKELKCLDPCMGSGHFIVAMFERLVALRMAEEELDEAEAVATVIADNLFGLEIDPRCTQIAAFNLALAAWRRVGYCKLPAMNLACSGLAPNAKEEDWLALAGDDEKLQNGMEQLYALFEKAPVLGSLINPRAHEGDLLVAAFHELQPLLEKALVQETKDDTAHEMAVTARGLAKAAEILAGQFTLVATNVPYLGRGKQDESLQCYCDHMHSEARADLATCFVERSMAFCGTNGSAALVTPQTWLFLKTFGDFRKTLLKGTRWNVVARLGPGAFEGISGEMVNVVLAVLSGKRESITLTNGVASMAGIDVSAIKQASVKADTLREGKLWQGEQEAQLANPDARITFDASVHHSRLGDFATTWQGLVTGDTRRFTLSFWELSTRSDTWDWFVSTPGRTDAFIGRSLVLRWEKAGGALHKESTAHNFPPPTALGKNGVLLSQFGNVHATQFLGEVFNDLSVPLIPHRPEDLPAILALCTDGSFNDRVRTQTQTPQVRVGYFLGVPFDLAYWQKVAAEKYPHGLPKPFSSDPTQWLFNGHPAGADQPLHVAVARLLGYQWPRQTGSSFPDCPALGPDGVEELADADGIVCLSAAKGEAPGAERLRALLSQALGKFDLSALLATAGPKGSKSKTLEDWLREEFFEQHCGIFHNRPFIWHIWDGNKNGFSALVNYHRLDHANLGKLTYAYLGDWIRRQQAAVDAEEAGSDAKLQAAKRLQATLKLILDGEPPYDIFVRWKGLSQQAIGWHPDLNDGVRMNIRPFMLASMTIPAPTNKDPEKKKQIGILRNAPNIKWDKDRGKEPVRDKKEFPWFWGWDEEKQNFTGVGDQPDGNRWNNCHYTNEFKKKAREADKSR